MGRWWRKFGGDEASKHKEGEASTSEEVFDSDLELGDEDELCESPTLVTVDDGKGGIKHIKVSRPLEGQAESEFSCANSLATPTLRHGDTLYLARASLLEFHGSINRNNKHLERIFHGISKVNFGSFIFEWDNVQMPRKVKCYQNAVIKNFFSC